MDGPLSHSQVAASGLSRASIEAIGYAGGLVLAVCLAPQLHHVIKNKSADDISYIWTCMYLVGVAITMVYLVLIEAVAGYVSLIVEATFLVALMVLKWYYARQKGMLMTNDAGLEEDGDSHAK
ncbi:hypothetical protein BCR44DRAFT_123204 [Catenaria anguillulae PL171]|uniref:PQ loop repeat-domain-containing protein n=1 Tax=Catenaria anguillulae PL171 TaxID=765915 RepID=A0A1Y2HCM8_9FUNG|nr:hypothetical protein BCR44DRAFT_123204 [Catenaria anguillulae PL171]